MKAIAHLSAGLLFCQAAVAIDLASSHFAVDSNRLYFTALFETVGLGVDLTFSLYSEPDCDSLPPSYELFQFSYNTGTGYFSADPEVITVGNPISDRWADGVTDHLPSPPIELDSVFFEGSIRNGIQPFLPEDSICMRIEAPFEKHTYNNLTITQTPSAIVSFKIFSTTRSITQAGQQIPYRYRLENLGPIFVHGISIVDENVDEAPVCAFDGNNELAPKGQPGALVFCTAQHTVTEQEFEAEGGVHSTVTLAGNEIEPIVLSHVVPIVLFANSFEGPSTIITEIESSGASDLVIAADGKPIIAYIEGSSSDLKVAKCFDLECTAAAFSHVHGGRNFFGYHPSIAIGADSLPIISFSDYAERVLLVAKCNDELCRGGDETISLVDQGDVGTYSSIAIRGDGTPIISYFDRYNGKLKVASCNDFACAGKDELITVLNDPAPVTGINTSMAIGNDDLPVISYQESVTPWDGTLKVAKCNDVHCEGGDENIVALDTTGGPTFESTSLAIGVDGNPTIAYMNNRLGAVMVAKCNDPGCSGGDEILSTLDFSGYQRLSLVIAPGGYPIISYMGSLKVALCNDYACSGGGESIAVVDRAAEARSSSIALGTDSLPVIVYRDQKSGSTRVVHCGSLECK